MNETETQTLSRLTWAYVFLIQGTSEQTGEALHYKGTRHCAEEILIGCREIMMEQSEIYIN